MGCRRPSLVARLHVPIPLLLGHAAASELVRRRRVICVAAEALADSAALLAVVRKDVAELVLGARVGEETTAAVHQLTVAKSFAWCGGRGKER